MLFKPVGQIIVSHHHIAGTYLLRYAQEASWREDNRRVPNGEQTDPQNRFARNEAETVGGFHRILATSQTGGLVVFFHHVVTPTA